MKKNYLLSAAAAFLLATMGCSDDIENGGNSGGENEGNNAYMTVHISTVADGVMTKADNDPTKPSNPNENGSGWGEDGNGWLGELPGRNEGMVYDINIFLFKTTNNTLTSENHLDLFNGKDDKLQVAGSGYYDVRVGGTGIDASEGENEPNHGSRNVRITMHRDLTETPENFEVFTIVNAGEDLKELTTLGSLRNYIQTKNVFSGTTVANANNFVMSTHKMVSNANPANLPSIVSLSSANTAENPAKTAVYVERLAARVDLAYNDDGALEFKDQPASPVNGKGTFALTGYVLINQWNGSTNMFKQVSPTVNSYMGKLTGSESYKDTDPKQYLGDEMWNWIPTSKPDGTFNFVLSEKFKEKTADDVTNEKWKNLYTNYFCNDLNDPSKLTMLPLKDDKIFYEDGDKIYYPISYVRENTLNTDAQVHGYSTGVIFRTKFTPNENFVMAAYADGKISDNAKLGNTDKFTFFTAEHFDGKVAKKVVYKDVKTVAARAFNIADETDKTDLLKGFMEGWTGLSPKLEDVQAAVNGMSIKNKLEEKFKLYLEEILKNAESLTDELKGRLTYNSFVSSQGSQYQDLFSETVVWDPTKIGLLAEHYGVSFFQNGESYHKFWIRHNDNMDDSKMGVMEFCIVRNNVYQLYVQGVRGLGDPLPYTPGKDKPDTPDESNEVTIDVTIYVKDWVKRTNKPIIL